MDYISDEMMEVKELMYCSYCKVKQQIYVRFADRLLRCSMCKKPIGDNYEN